MSPATPTEPHLIPSVEPPPTRIRRRSPAHQSSAQRSLAIVNMSPGELVVARARLRKYQPRHREHLLQSVKRWGIVEPILIDADRRVIAGHQILAAALELGLATVPTIALADLSDAQARALRIALNKLPELSSWDPSALKDELAFLADFDIDLVSFTAFSSAELDVILSPPRTIPTTLCQGH